MASLITAPQPDAVEIGANVLAAGGSEYDAALACAFAQFVIDPHSCGVGGYILFAQSPAGGETAILDAPAVAGSRARPEMWVRDLIGPNPGGWGFFLKGKVNEDGYHSICVPAGLRGLAVIHERHCTRPWAELLAPAIDLAENGFVVTGYMAARWRDEPQYYEGSSLFQKLQVSAEARRIYLRPDGSPRSPGEIIRNPDYAATLRRIAAAGAEDFYAGDLARRVSQDLAAHGSWVTADDLAEAGCREEPPVSVEYRGYTVVTCAAPHGGPTLAQMLRILEGYSLAKLGHNSPEYIRLVARAMQGAFADRSRELGDPRFVPFDLAAVLSQERTSGWRKVIDSGEPIPIERVQVGSRDTTQVTVVDSAGNCVSLTHSLGSSSGVITPGLGFMHNNSMVNFHPLPGHPNSIAPGKGRTTGMTPTIVLKEGRPVLVLGAPGATRIITSVMQVILNRLDFGMSLTEAVLGSRFDCQGETIFCQSRIPEGVCREVRRRQPISRLPVSHGGMALVHAIAIDESTGELQGAADAGAEGMALRV